MGLAAIDISLDPHCYASGSSSFNWMVNRPAIHLMISETEIKQKFSLLQGSGGSLAPYSINQSGGNNIVLVSLPNKLANAVNEISEVFGLTKDELAQILKVQRKSLYNWINGDSKPRKAAMHRVFDLFAIANALKTSDLSTDKAYVHTPIIDERSLFDLLSDANIDQQRIIFAASKLDLMTRTTKVLADPFA